MISILRCAVAAGEGSSELGVFPEGLTLSLFICASPRDTKGVRELDVPFMIQPLKVVLLSSCTCVFPFCSLYFTPFFFWVLWFIYYDRQGFISLSVCLAVIKV